ncbi:hypothetical protein AAFM46_10880 [Arthrobacter sp. TMP15]|uniref:hypothetical protein n=1 Tax=Arthrobacter sp. TMP15 TaxID=3140789 RepID=UPI0031BA75AF
MGEVVRPSVRVAANRRRAFLWLPVLLTGALVSVAGGSMITVFNSLDAAGLVLLLAGLFGFIREVEK